MVSLVTQAKIIWLRFITSSWQCNINSVRNKWIPDLRVSCKLINTAVFTAKFVVICFVATIGHYYSHLFGEKE